MASSNNPNICPAYADCKAPIDVIFRSSDGKQFAAHKSYLGTYTGGFPSAEMTEASAKPEVIELEEKADVLLLVLQFAHPERPPSTVSLENEVIMRLAEAVEKYVVFGAMEVCRLRMRDIAKKEPIKVFRFAIKYGDQYLSDYCAPLTLNFGNMETMRSELRGLDRYFPAYVAWLRFKNTQRGHNSDPFGGFNDNPSPQVHAKSFQTFYAEELSIGGGI